MAEQDRRAALDERLAQLFRDLFVETRQHLLFQLHYRDFGSEGLVKIAKFEPDRARADNDYARR